MASPPKSENEFEISDEEEGMQTWTKTFTVVYWNYSLENLPAPVSADSIGYVYHRPIEEDSDVESLVDELWGLEIEDDTESEEDDEDEADNDEDEDHEEDLEVGDLPEDMNARCKTLFMSNKSKLLFICHFVFLFYSVLQWSIGESSERLWRKN